MLTPDTRELYVGLSASRLRSLGTTQMPVGAMASHRLVPDVGGRIVTRPRARSATRLVEITTFCRYVPRRTTTVSPGWDRSTAAWMDWPGRTVRWCPPCADAGAASATDVATTVAPMTNDLVMNRMAFPS